MEYQNISVAFALRSKALKIRYILTDLADVHWLSEAFGGPIILNFNIKATDGTTIVQETESLVYRMGVGVLTTTPLGFNMRPVYRFNI